MTAAALLALRKAAPWLVGAALIAALVAALLLTRSTLARERLQRKVEIAEINRAAAERVALNAVRSASAAAAYADRTAAAQPIIIRSKDEVIRYAQTPAGAAVCRDADRVRSVDQFDAALFTPAPASVGAGAVHANAAAPPAGR